MIDIEQVLDINQDAYLDICNIALGVFNPLKGFLDGNDYRHVVDDMHLASGEPWTIPITLDVDEARMDEVLKSDKIILKFQNKVVAFMFPSDVFKVHYDKDIVKVFGTEDISHPGVKREISRSPFRVGGEIQFVEEDVGERENYELKPEETKALFKDKGWKTIVGFQTRNPIHRAHEYLQRVALETVDGLFIQPLLGWKKKGDFSPQAVVQSYQRMVNEFYPKESVVFGSLNTSMRYAGPREAVFHALIRRNYGCTHFIVGRDHAGVGAFYDKYAAHRLCEQFNDLGITILRLHGPFYCNRCMSIVTEKTCAHTEMDITQISGTEIRAMISQEKFLPKEYMREEISEVLINLYKIGEAFCE